MKKAIWNKIGSLLIIINGIICLTFSEHILNLLPTICGITLLIKGLIQFAGGIKNKDYASLEQINLEKSIVAIAIAIGILLKQNESLFIIGMFWGLSGLIKSANSFNISLYNICNKKKFILILIESLVEFILSLMLIFDPFANVSHHILILGLELFLEGSIELFSKSE
ncbi:DUF308 domain-containing protein [Clostridioides difficile]